MKALNPAFISKYQISGVKVNGKEFYYSPLRIPNNETPDGFTRYEVRDSDDGTEWATIEKGVMVNFACTLLTDEPMELERHIFWGKDDYYTDIESVEWE